MGSIGCGGLGVSGGGGDSVIRLTQNIIGSVGFADPQGVVESIQESVSVVVT